MNPESNQLESEYLPDRKSSRERASINVRPVEVPPPCGGKLLFSKKLGTCAFTVTPAE
jgi:hypothetical protein